MPDPSEKLLNRLLRRVDWRFLLDNPWPRTSLCLQDGFLARAMKEVSQGELQPNESATGTYDLVVGINPGRADLKKSREWLRPGGSFYSEWYSPFTGGRVGITKRLEAAGFMNVKCYWPWLVPNISPALFWLPVDAPQAVNYFLSTRIQSGNHLGMFADRLMQIFWRLLHRINLLVPVCVTAIKPELPAAPGSLEGLSNQASERDIGTTGVDEAEDYLLWTGGQRSINKVIRYEFRQGEKEPLRVVKFPRTREASRALAHEADILSALQARGGGTGVRVPELLFVKQYKDLVAIGETAVFGKPLYTQINPGNAEASALKVTDWLLSLLDDREMISPDILQNQWIEPFWTEFEFNYGAALDANTRSRIRSILSHLLAVPAAFEHRDCSPWNLLMAANGELAVLDWESAEQHGLASLDLIYFLTYLVFFLEGSMESGEFTAAYRRASDPSTSTGALQAACLGRYMNAARIDPTALRPLRLLTWLLHSRSEFQRLSADVGGPPSPATLQHSLFYNLVLEELALEQAVSQVENHQNLEISLS